MKSKNIEGREPENNSIDVLFEQIEELIEDLESEEITLEDSFARYKKGMELLKQCNDKIDTIEKKVLALNEEGGLDEF